MPRGALSTRHDEPRSPSRETPSHSSLPTTVSTREPILKRHQHSIRNLVRLTSTYSHGRRTMILPVSALGLCRQSNKRLLFRSGVLRDPRSGLVKDGFLVCC